MLFTAFFSWWYGAGYAQHLARVRASGERLLDTLSLSQLLATLFAPFKQIDAVSARATVPMEVKMRIWFDRMFSRVFGSVIRSFMIIIGLLALAVWAVAALVRLVWWPLLPLLPVAGIVLMSMGWLPWK
jgi:hypothetical protein